MPPSKPARTERQLSPEKTKAILEGGMQEFLAHGYAATSMDRVAIAAKVSKATVYSHFQDKESLFIALIQRLAEQNFNPFWCSGCSSFANGTAGCSEKFCRRALDMGANEPQCLNFMRLILGESERFPQLAHAFVSNIEQTAFGRLCHYFTNCPQLRLFDPKATARIFVGAIVHFMIVQKMLYGKKLVPMDSDRLIDGLIDLIVEQRSQLTDNLTTTHN